MTKKRTVIAVPTDTHCGSKCGLISLSNPYSMSDGGTYTPKFGQKLLWKQWEECWQHIAELRKHSRLIVVHCGDATEGLHHDLSELITLQPDDHKQIHIDAMDYALQKAKYSSGNGDLLYYISGTPAHCGKGNTYTNDVAKDFGAMPRFENCYHWGYLPLKVNGKLILFAHEGVARGRMAWTSENALRGYVKSVMFDAIGYGREVPRFIVHAHRHKHVRSGIVSLYGHECEGIILPAFQSKTDLVYKKYPLELSDVGMVYIIVEEDGSISFGSDMTHIEQDPIQEV